MKVSSSFFSLLEYFEGFVSCPYKDSAGVPTIGIGTTRYPDGTRVKMTDECVKHDKAIFYATNAIAGVEWAISSLGLNLTQNQFDALVSFVYNIGTGAFSGSTLLKKLKVNPNDLSIRQEFMKWTKVRVNGELTTSDWQVKRRTREANLYYNSH